MSLTSYLAAPSRDLTMRLAARVGKETASRISSKDKIIPIDENTRHSIQRGDFRTGENRVDGRDDEEC